MEYDIIVGVTTKNDASTIAHILTTIDKALLKLKRDALILVVDGYSTDKTKSIVSDTNLTTELRLITEKGKKGKGSAVKTVLQKAKVHGVSSVLLVDGDFSNITVENVLALLKPVVVGTYDVVLPKYTRDKYDCLISSQVIYPLMKTLFHTSIRDPLPGEYALSKKAVSKLLQSSYFPADQGIGIFVTLTAVCESLSTAEVRLGSKDHTSSEKYKQPEEHLMPVFNHILREFIKMMRYYKTFIKKETIPKVTKIGKQQNKRPKRIEINEKAYKDLSRDVIDDLDDYAEAVYENLNKQNIMGLKVAWLNWLTIYFEKTKNMSNEKAEKEIEKIASAFKKKKELLNL